ncbi:BatA domain-containing protein [Nonlabens ponticola]|uniref:Alpha-1-antitrypsin n=1 Tax=Nonlabens ponticola TaxID=2496866 RepID=A0A3S9MZC8_9FLAO|nr:BatA domain-containing protein [Nonlabens ponticola]AZQ44499.1 alpha-1-antitrypsin [Nonlabens ponticola]
MLFKYPAVLYGLFFLLLPILIHLFQLRRFKKKAFTNVAFLKPLVTQTRKSRSLKKWLVLLTRLLAAACIIIAFAQPFFSNPEIETSKGDLIIYLDDSASMERQGKDGKLLQEAIRELLEHLDPSQTFTLFTNKEEFPAVNKTQIANQLQRIKATGVSLSPEDVILKANNLAGRESQNTQFLWISDFQQLDNESFPDSTYTLQTSLVALKPQESNNISIDSAFIKDKSISETIIEVQLSADNETDKPVTLSLSNTSSLIAKSTTTINSGKGVASFSLPANEQFIGNILIEDNSMTFDNVVHLAINKNSKVKVLHVNDSPSDFLNRIFTADEFEYVTTTSNKLNYNLIKDQQVVVLNEVGNIPTALVSQINSFTRSGGVVLLIPPSNQHNYDQFTAVSSSEIVNQGNKITSINFDHPLLQGVFNKRIQNFQYPSVNSTSIQSNSRNKILSYADGSPFLYQSGNIYVFTAALNQENSNFQNSPLIVPVIYNIGLSTSNKQQLYVGMDRQTAINIPTTVQDDQVLELTRNDVTIIPPQRAYDSYVQIETGQEIPVAGIYDVRNGDNVVYNIAYNENRIENTQNTYNLSSLENVETDIASVLIKRNENALESTLWKWFLMGGLLFLIVELLILKFVK